MSRWFRHGSTLMVRSNADQRQRLHSCLLNLRRLNELGRLRCHGIAMMEATHATERLNSLFDARGRDQWAICRRILGEPEVRSVVMVIPDVLSHEAFQMAFVQNNHMIQQISTEGSPINPGILPSGLATAVNGSSYTFSVAERSPNHSLTGAICSVPAAPTNLMQSALQEMFEPQLRC